MSRSEVFKASLQNLLGNAFAVTKADERYKAKKKGVAHTFFKDKLIVMLEKLKDYVMEAQQRWLE